MKIEPVSKNADTILSSGQQRLWYIDQLVPGNPIYNLPAAYRLAGPVDSDAVKQAVNDIVRRHEILRTTFVMGEKGPVQAIFPPLEMNVPLIDFSKKPAHEREKALDEYLESEAWKPFDLTAGPLIRASLVKMKQEEYVFFLLPHHLVFDGTSFGLFQRDFFSFYNARVTGGKPNLPTLPVQYADFAVCQGRWLESGDAAAHLAYWQEKIGSEMPVLDLPADYPRPALLSIQGRRVPAWLSREKIEALAKVGCAADVSLFEVLLAGFKILLARYTGQTDIIVASPVDGRLWPETENLLGFFENTLIFRSGLEENPPFDELVKRVKNVCAEALRHREYPFERLVEVIQPEGDLSRTPVYQAMIAYEPGARKHGIPENISWSRHRIPSRVSRTDLSLWIVETEDGLSLELEYSPELFSDDKIRRMSGHFMNLLDGIIKDPCQNILDLPFITKKEIEEFNEWNDTGLSYPKDATICDLFEKQAVRTPDKAAVVYEDKNHLSYGELNRQSSRLANYLCRIGVRSGMFVGIYVDRCAEMLVGLLGILKAGGVYVPLDPDYPKERRSYMIEDTGMAFLVTQEMFTDELPECSVEIVYLDAHWPHISGESSESPPREVSPEDLAYVIYTSGSTGKPKGVKLPHRAVVNFLVSMARTPGIDKNDTLLAITTLSFDIAVLEMFLPLTVGAKVVIAGRETNTDIQALIALLESSGTNFMQASPSTWRMMLLAGWQGDSQLKILCGGEAFPKDLAKELVSKCGELWNMYGPTETTVWSTCYRMQDSSGPILIGRPVGNTQVYVLDANMQRVPTGVFGELYIGGDGVSSGYHNKPELTAKAFVQSPFQGESSHPLLYKTGDLCRFHPDGNLEYLHRIDTQVKVRGFRIELGEIESRLEEHDAVKQAVAIIKQLSPGDVRLAAFIVTSGHDGIIGTELRRHLRANLPEYMIPQHFVEKESIPLTPSGKVDRKKLESGFVINGSEDEAIIEPSTESEKYLARVWEEALQLSPFGTQHNFFNIGGHSLLAMRVISRIADETGVSVRPRDMLLNTLGQIASDYNFAPQASPGPKPSPDGFLNTARKKVGAFFTKTE